MYNLSIYIYDDTDNHVGVTVSHAKRISKLDKLRFDVRHGRTYKTLRNRMSQKKALPINEYKHIKHNIGNGKPTILAFGMSHCYSCLAMSKVFAEVLEAHPEYQIYSIDSQKERLIARDTYKLKEMPTQIFLNEQGEEVFRHTGAYKKPVLDIILKKWGFI